MGKERTEGEDVGKRGEAGEGDGRKDEESREAFSSRLNPE